MKVCLQCQKDFEPKRERAKFCSDLCRATYHQNIKSAKAKFKAAGNNGSEAADLYKKLMDATGNIAKITFEFKPEEHKKAKESVIKGLPIIYDEAGQWQETDLNFPKRKEGESGLDYKIRCAEYTENKNKPTQ